MTMRLRFWGTRGSVPTPGPHTVRYGGNTPCLEVRTETGGLVILDAGTGIRELGRSLVADGSGGGVSADIFLTHAHWDHIQGLPFFAPIFQAGNRFTIWGSGALEQRLDRVVRDQMAPVVFPVSFDQLQATVEFGELDGSEHAGNGYVVRSFPVRHPGGAIGYRFCDAARAEQSFVYISDNELGDGQAFGASETWRDDLVEFVRGASLLVHDATYTMREYEHHRGWGHSTYEDAVTLALEADVGQLVLYHHKPERSDDEVDRCLETCRQMVRNNGGGLAVIAAAEGMTLSV